ncbi:sensor histidine kinase [Phormidium sp. CCY1219]|uniref:sensor histidine kinase n=1 Tax=Phormidium sp. CCY1219 TaxID=2886104 RepID=UPI002D1F78D2|nr:ATP-binding protein [Phormidium sp. CCY1219]MEB3826066.1 HAMP domain-containing histidine kinase [Phormidium sp. CCY1219]
MQAQLTEQTRRLDRTSHELKQAQSHLVQSEKMASLGQLVVGVAHEINNPVNFITGNLEHASQYIQELQELLQLYQAEFPDASEEIKELEEEIDVNFLMDDLPKLLSSMQVGADRIREIVLSLRNFSRIDECKATAVDIHQCIDSTLLILQNRLKGKKNHPEIHVIKEYGNLPLVECYPGQLNQVFMNLLSNAIDALDEANQSKTPEQLKAHPNHIKIKTQLRVGQFGFPNPKNAPPSSLAEENNTPSNLQNESEQITTEAIEIRISDNGPGIADSVKEQLFQPFVTTKPVGKGTGLGLSISRHIVVEKHGGQLFCHSQTGKGTQFAIAIPTKQQVESQ